MNMLDTKIIVNTVIGVLIAGALMHIVGFAIHGKKMKGKDRGYGESSMMEQKDVAPAAAQEVAAPTN